MTHPAFLRFVVVGGTCFGVNLLILLLGTGYLGLPYLASAAVSFLVVTYLGLHLNRWWVFKVGDGQLARHTVRYYAATVLSLITSLLLMYLLVDLVELHYVAANVVAACILLAANFTCHRFWTFARSGHA